MRKRPFLFFGDDVQISDRRSIRTKGYVDGSPDYANQVLADLTEEAPDWGSDQFAVGLWFRPIAQPSTQAHDLLEIKEDGNTNRIRFRWRQNGATGTLYVRWNDKDDSGIYRYEEWDNLANEDDWNLLIVNGKGSVTQNYNVFLNGVAIHGSSDRGGNTGNPAFDNSATRTISIGGSFDGSGNVDTATAQKIYSVMMWSSILSSGEASSLYNSGNGIDVDPTSDFGSYSSSSDLVAWWRPGYDRLDLGKDHSANNHDWNLFDDANLLSEADLVADAPGL